MKIHLYRRQHLSDLIVQLTRDSPSFFFLRFDQMARKHLQRVLRQFAFRDVTGCSLDADYHTVFIDRTTANLDGNAASVLCDHIAFVSRFTLSSELRAKPFTHLTDVLGGEKLNKAVTYNLIARVA